MDILLTDDEVVALTAASRMAWPYGLRTVAADERALVAAGLRGVRSLAVRGLVDTGSPDGVVYAPELVQRFVEIASASHHVVAQVCARDDVLVPKGAVVGAFAVGKAWLTDSVTVSGVHAIRLATAGEAADLLLRFVSEVWDNGVSSSDVEKAYGLLVTCSAPGCTSFFVSQGRTEALVLGEEGFEQPADLSEERWTVADVRDLMTARSGAS